ncbi:aldolase catalytic domain-containing protein [Salegentibacter sp. Hel_I_6]|uniref:aldolase catalytic domain-containing protein n=1 Tax=Salegentibacter sp. Hel_I_6 TaxID=1250278 RepID=UPI000564E9F4|nr:aldolase catalytic domain-containing protein [Salegentibacter sp. Hel_I_6]
MSNSRQFKILDCSLRDGGYYTNWDFEEELVDTYLKAMNNLPIDIIEIGYRSPTKENYAGGHFYLPDFLIDRIKKQTDKNLAIILNEKDVEASIAAELISPCINKIKLVRLAVAPQNFERGIDLATKIKELGFEVAFNLMYASKWEEGFPNISQIKSLNKVCDYFYVVDSYGGLFPEDVNRIFNYIKAELKIALGFHGHNNLEMALVNTLEAAKCGADILDATIDGMGRGAGNLKTELLLSVLYERRIVDVNFDILNEVRETFLKLKPKYNWGTNLPYMVSGSFSLPQNEVMEQVNKRYFSLNNIIDKVTLKKPTRKFNLSAFKPSNKTPEVLVVGGGNSVEVHKTAIREFLQANPSMPVILASSKNSNVFEYLNNPNIHLIPGKELQRLRDKISQEEFKKKILIVPPGFKSPEYIENMSFFSLPEETTYHFPDSVTEYCLIVAEFFKAKKIFLSGYDGYGNLINKAQQELFEENERVFSFYKRDNLELIALTPSEYSVEKSSIYSFL